ncbi:hypothetical protein MHB77_23940 [Paenibacillus sp. FSL K6-3166]
MQLEWVARELPVGEKGSEAVKLNQVAIHSNTYSVYQLDIAALQNNYA